jgi:hypothetical protein
LTSEAFEHEMAQQFLVYFRSFYSLRAFCSRLVVVTKDLLAIFIPLRDVSLAYLKAPLYSFHNLLMGKV